MNNFNQQITDKAFENLIKAWDLETQKDLLTFMCKTIPAHDLENLLLKNIKTAIWTLRLFLKTGLDDTAAEAPTWPFYIKLVSYIIRNAESQEVREIFKEIFEDGFFDIEPIGCDENKNNIYSLLNLAEGFNVSFVELLNEFKNEMVQIKQEVTTMH